MGDSERVCGPDEEISNDSDNDGPNDNERVMIASRLRLGARKGGGTLGGRRREKW